MEKASYYKSDGQGGVKYSPPKSNESGGLQMRFELPIMTVSEANSSEHWTTKKKRHDMQQWQLKIHWINNEPKIILPCKITLTRLSSRMLDDDNLVMSFKWIRDQIADLIFPGQKKGVADSDKRIKWEYQQEKKSPQGIRIEIFDIPLF